MPTKILCQYNLTVAGNQSQASLAARLAAVPLDLSLPAMWGLIPDGDATTEPSGTVIERLISLNMGHGTASITAALDSSPTTGAVSKLTLGATVSYFAAPPILSFSKPNPSGLVAAAVPIMGVKQAVVANGGSGYNGATTTAKLVGGNIAPGGTPATLGAMTIIGNVVTNVAIATPGSGYTTYPVIVITDSSGAGSGAEVYGGLNLVGVTLNSGGSLYSVAPIVTVTPLFDASAPAELGETTDATMANWMTIALQIGVRSPVLAFVPQIV